MKKYRFSDGTIVEASCKEEAKAKHKVTASFLYAKEKAKVIPKVSALVKEIAKQYGFEVKKDAKKMIGDGYFEWYLIKGKHGTTCDAKIDITLGSYLRFNAFNCRTFAEVTKANIASFETFKKYLTNTCSQLFKKTKVTASTKEEAIAKHKVMADSGFYKFKKPLSEMLKENKDLTIKLGSSSHGEVCPNCEAIIKKDNLKFYPSNHSLAFCHHVCPYCKCEWDANFKLTPTVIDNIVMPK